MENEKELSFEEALAELEKAADFLKDGEAGLEESVKVYEKSILYYNRCVEILKNAKQKIELYNPERGETEAFDGYQ